MLQLQSGTDQLNDGLVQFNAEGISQLTGALDADQLHALQAVVEEMTSRLAGYTSFAGAPEGAEQRVKFIYKTAETPAETAPVETAADNATEGNFSSACGTACWRCSGCKDRNYKAPEDMKPPGPVVSLCKKGSRPRQSINRSGCVFKEVND